MGIFAGIVPLFRSLVTLAVSQADFSLPSLHPKIPFPAAGFSTANTGRQLGNSGSGGQKRHFGPVRNYCGFNPRASNCWLHSAGASRSRSNSDAAWQATFDRRADEIWCEERERDGHVDLTHAAFLTCCDLLNVGHGARNDFVKPATTSGDGADEAGATFDPRWADFAFGDAVRESEFAWISWMAASARGLRVNVRRPRRCFFVVC